MPTGPRIGYRYRFQRGLSTPKRGVAAVEPPDRPDHPIQAYKHEDPTLASELIKHVSDTSFENDVLKAGKPVLVDFWAEWCGPCKSFAPVLDEVAKEYQDRLTIAKLDIDSNPSTPAATAFAASLR